MSNSFWKFNQDYSIDSNINNLLNHAFIKKVDNNNNNNNISNPTDTNNSKNNVNISQLDDPNPNPNQDLINEENLNNYDPNLNILNDLIDDEELYTELMCSNSKLLMYLKYPSVLDKLIDFIINEKFLYDSYQNEINQMNQNDNTETDQKDDLNQEVILLSKEEQLNRVNKLEHLQKINNKSDSKLNSNSNLNSNSDSNSDFDSDFDSNSIVSQETSVTLPPETEEQIEFRRAKMASEVLSADIWQISTTIIENKSLLNKIWSILDDLQNSYPLSVTVSTYFMKINERLLDINMSKMIEYLLTKDNLVDKFLKNINNPSLMDFLLKVISTDKPDSPTGIIDLLYRQNFIPKLIDLIDASNSPKSISSASSAADFIKAFVTLSANSNNDISIGIGPNELTRHLVSSEMVERLIKIMLKGGASLSNGVGIIIEIIRKNNSDYDFIQVMYTTLETHPPNDRDSIHLIHLIKLCAKNMPEFMKLLTKIETRRLSTPFGSIEPLGFERFKICELIAELLHCSNMVLLNEPNGEMITRERDLVRFQKLHGDCISKEELIQLNEDLKILQLENNLNNSDKETADKDNNDNDNDDEIKHNEYENSLEIYPNDEISISSDTETQIRNKHIPGDNLKISLKDTGILDYIIDMFFKFEWNNFLHNVVFDIIQQVFNGPLKCGYNKFLIKDLLSKTYITDKIIQGDTKCTEYEQEKGIRLGYMGHLILIAEEMAKFVEYIDEMKITFDDDGISNILNNDDWKTFMNTTLADTRDKYNTVLGDFILDGEEVDEIEQGQHLSNEESGYLDNEHYYTEEELAENDAHYEKEDLIEKEYEAVNPDETHYDYYDENVDYHDEKDDEEDEDRYHDIDSSEEETELYGVSLKRQPNHDVYQDEDESSYEYEDTFGNSVVINLHEDDNENNDANTSKNLSDQEQIKNKENT
ncbi:Sap190p PWA37_004408 [Arxiozyma heterogenica]|uniref:Sap190p n=1 Tax=Arxiozyma heterogenica TaxID=278026 RepID=UPI002F1736CB